MDERPQKPLLLFGHKPALPPGAREFNMNGMPDRFLSVKGCIPRQPWVVLLLRQS